MVGAETGREDVGCVEDAVAVGVGRGVARPEVADEVSVLDAVVGVGDGGGGVPGDVNRGGGASVESDTGDVVVLVDPVVLTSVTEVEGVSVAGTVEGVSGDGIIGGRCVSEGDDPLCRCDVDERVIDNVAVCRIPQSKDKSRGSKFISYRIYNRIVLKCDIGTFRRHPIRHSNYHTVPDNRIRCRTIIS
ncbi:hypothetical protein DSECCO2_580860 [anaerobic digester metagenome]